MEMRHSPSMGARPPCRKHIARATIGHQGYRKTTQMAGASADHHGGAQ